MLRRGYVYVCFGRVCLVSEKGLVTMTTSSLPSSQLIRPSAVWYVTVNSLPLVVVVVAIVQEGLAVARIARDDLSPLPPEIPASSHPTIRVRRCQ